MSHTFFLFKFKYNLAIKEVTLTKINNGADLQSQAQGQGFPLLISFHIIS